MLIHPWDAVEDWRPLLARHDFGQLITAGHVDGWPVVVPTHFLLDDEVVLLHLARPNPVWEALEADDRVLLGVIADYVYVDAATNANPGTELALGVPTSYYSAVQLQCRAEIVDDPGEKAAILARQLRHFEPSTQRVTPSVDVESDRRLLPGIRGLRLHVQSVRAKQKYGGNKTPQHREAIAEALALRDGPMDRAASKHVRHGRLGT